MSSYPELCANREGSHSNLLLRHPVTVALARKFPFYSRRLNILTVSNARFSKMPTDTDLPGLFPSYCSVVTIGKKYSHRVYRICVASAHPRGYSGDNKAQFEKPGHKTRSSHNAMWQRMQLLVFKASLEWLTDSSVNGTKKG
jgi:hypothetical protein